MSRSIVFRADASEHSGLGHVRRCMTLAYAFSAAGWAVGFAKTAETAALLPELTRFPCCIVSESIEEEASCLRETWPGGVGVFLVDNYALAAEYEAMPRGWARRIGALDDWPSRMHDVDFLIDYTPGRKEADYVGRVPSAAKLLTGAQYVPVRPEILVRRQPEAPAREVAQATVVTFGGADPTNLTGRVVAAAKHLPVVDMNVEVILGPAYRSTLDWVIPNGNIRIYRNPPNFADLVASADIAIAGSGTTCWELAHLGIPSLLIANSPGDVVPAMVRAGAARCLAGDVTELDIAAAWNDLAADPAARTAMRAAGRVLVDGQGARRIVAEIEALLS